MSDSNPVFAKHGSYRQCFTTGAVTTIAAGTATAGHLLALRNAVTGLVVRVTRIEADFILTTAFGAAQEVGFDVHIVRSYSAAHTGGTALTITGNTGKKHVNNKAPELTGRIADTGALTAGTHTFDTNALIRESAWMNAIGDVSSHKVYTFSSEEGAGPIYLATNEGIVVRNTILMGATGVGKWHFSIDWDEGAIG